MPGRTDSEPVPVDERLGRAELIARTGIDESTLAELERLGVLGSGASGWYDGDAVIIARAVAGLATYGLEPRHLRGFRSAADREVGLFAQLVAPLARQKDPAARARADGDGTGAGRALPAAARGAGPGGAAVGSRRMIHPGVRRQAGAGVRAVGLRGYPPFRRVRTR